MPSRYRKKPLAQFGNGTRSYAPSSGEPRFRVVATDPATGERIFAKLLPRISLGRRPVSSSS